MKLTGGPTQRGQGDVGHGSGLGEGVMDRESRDPQRDRGRCGQVELRQRSRQMGRRVQRRT